MICFLYDQRNSNYKRYPTLVLLILVRLVIEPLLGINDDDSFGTEWNARRQLLPQRREQEYDGAIDLITEDLRPLEANYTLEND